MNPIHSVPSSRRADAGFTLIELLVSLAVTAVLILGVLATFDFSARMNKVQLNVADMQQSLRIAQNEVVRLSRMTGRGSLPTNIAVEVANNRPAGSKLVATDGLTEIEPLTDVLRLRGVFSSSLYQIDWQNPSVWGTPGADGKGSVLIKPLAAGVPQDLEALLKVAMPDDKPGESLLLVTPFDIHAVAQIVSAAKEGENLKITFERHPNETALAGPLTAGMPAAAYIGILEEYAFYVRHGNGSDAPALAKARLEPGSSLPYNYKNDPASGNARLDLADNIYDLQVALGFGVAGAPELRVTTLVRTDRSDAGQYLAPLLPALIGDHAYPTNHLLNSTAERRHRWRLMQTSVNLRNL